MYTETDLNALEAFFASNRPLPLNVKVSPGTTICDPEKFVSSHLAVLRNHLGRPVFRSFYQHLVVFKEYLEKG